MQVDFKMCVAGLLAVFSLAISLPGLAQTVDFDVLVDTDRSVATGCSVTPTGGPTLAGFEHRIRASVDLSTFQVSALEQASCAGGAFGAALPVQGFSVPYPLALNTGTAGSDAVELAVARAAIGATNLNQLRFAFVTDNGSGSDTLAQADGADGGPIVFGLPVQIPALSVWGLGALVLVLLGMAWMAQRSMGRVGAVTAVMLVTSAAWAMTFVLDGDLSDWGGRGPNAIDPTGDATDGSAAIDLIAGFVALDGDDLFFRMDVSDTENQAPVAVDDAFSTDEDTPLNEPVPGVLGNDSDADSDPITAVLDGGPANAQSFTLNADGSFEYTPNPDFNGTDTFTYFANDGQADSDPATVTITVNAVNDPPAAGDDSAGTNEDTQVDIDVLANDSDVDGNLDPASVTVTILPANGSTSVNPVNGVITYTKSGNFNGSDGFVYQVCDDGSPLPVECATASVAITIDPVNDPPQADATSVSTDEDNAVTITLTGSDVEGDPLTFAIATAPANGSLGPVTQINATTAEVVYTPAADFSGSDSFTYTTNDGSADSVPAVVDITASPVNDPPEADAGAAGTDEDTPVTITLTGSDVDGDPLTFAIASAPANGSLGAITPINATTAEIVYTPNADFNGADAFTFTVNDGTVDSAAATISLTVNPVNDPPTADAAAAGTDEDTAVTITLTGSDVDGDPLTFAIASAPMNGGLGAITPINATTAEVVYTPNADFNGADAFTFTVNDGTVDSTAATITLTVNPVNDPPTADAAAAGTDEDTPVTITLTGSDVEGDPLTFAIASAPANGSLGAITPINATTAEIVYTPNADFNGADAFTFTVNDGTVDSAAATISLTVNPVNDPPTADAAAAGTDEDTPVTITLTGSDVDGDPLTFAIASAPMNGSLGAITPINATTAEVVYTPNGDFNGADAFAFTVNDGTVDSAAATVSLTVNPVNDAPTANSDTATTEEDTPVTITLTGSDVDGDPLTFAIASAPANGSLGAITPINATTAEVVYTPNGDFNGADAFAFTVNDGTVDSAAATVSLTVNPVNDAPTANSDTATTEEDTPVTITLTGSDVDGDPLTFAIASAPANGSLGAITPINATTAEVVYTPNTGFDGPDSFTFTASDSALSSPTATISITVTPGNEPPVADAAAATTDEDTPITITLTGSDADSDPLTFAIATGPSNGGLSAITPINATSASVTYTPNLNFFGTDAFTFTVNDGTETSTAATVSLTVNAVNDAPTVVNHTLTTHSAIRITLGAADSELLKDGAADVDDATTALSVQPLAATSTNGATLTLIDAATGTYSYDPPGGFTGADTFSYQVCDSASTALPVECATATVNVTVTGPALWIVNPAAAPGGNGSLTAPFQALSNLPGGRASGGRIFLFSGANIGGHGFAASEHLIGQGATGNTFDGFLGVQVPANGTLDGRPAVAGTRPVVGGQVTLNAGALARGFNIAPPAAVTGLFGNGAFTGVDVSQMNVTTTGATAVSLTGLTGDFFLDRVDANGGPSGISLNNTGAAGFFVVNGDGSNARNGSGGTIQNTTSHGVVLNNTANVTLNSVTISGPGDAAGEHGILATGLTGSNFIRGATFSGQDNLTADYIRVNNAVGTLTLLEVSNSLFTGVVNAGNDGILFNITGSATARLDVLSGTHFDGLLGDGVQVIADNQSAVTANVLGSRFSNDSNIQPGGLGGNSASRLTLVTTDALLVNGGTLVANVSNNVMLDTGVQAGALPVGLVGVLDLVSNQAGGATLTATGNTISEIEEDGAKRFIGDDDTVLFTLLIDNNDTDDVNEPAVFFNPRNNTVAADLTVRNNRFGAVTPVGTENANFNEDTIRLFPDDGAGSGAGNSIDILIEDNTIVNNSSSQGIDGDFDGDNAALLGSRTNLTIHGNQITNLGANGEAFDLEADNLGFVCLDMNSDNLAGDSNTHTDGPTTANSELHHESDGGGFAIEGIAANPTGADVQTFLTARNTFSGVLDVVVETGFSAAAGECQLPALP